MSLNGEQQIGRVLVRRPRFGSNTCSSLHSSPVKFESCVIYTLTDIRATWQQVTEIHPDLQVISKVFCDTRIWPCYFPNQLSLYTLIKEL